MLGAPLEGGASPVAPGWHSVSGLPVPGLQKLETSPIFTAVETGMRQDPRRWPQPEPNLGPSAPWGKGVHECVSGTAPEGSQWGLRSGGKSGSHPRLWSQATRVQTQGPGHIPSEPGSEH